MRRAWLIALAATLPPTALAQDQQSSLGIVIRDFSVTDSPCRYKHDGAVEEALQTVRIVTNAAKSSPDGQVATVELRNKAAKTITAYILNYTFAHDGKTDYYGGHGADLVYEMAVSKQNPKQTTFLPGVVIKQEITGQRGHGQFRFRRAEQIHPCGGADVSATGDALRESRSEEIDMIAVIFEVWPKPEYKQEYLDLAAELRPVLETIDGFISVERFESLTEKGKILSLSFFRDEAAVEAWRNVPGHRKTQGKGRARIFENYRLRIAGVIRDYGMNEREQAPKDSRAAHDAR